MYSRWIKGLLHLPDSRSLHHSPRHGPMFCPLLKIRPSEHASSDSILFSVNSGEVHLAIAVIRALLAKWDGVQSRSHMLLYRAKGGQGGAAGGRLVIGLTLQGHRDS